MEKQYNRNFCQMLFRKMKSSSFWVFVKIHEECFDRVFEFELIVYFVICDGIKNLLYLLGMIHTLWDRMWSSVSIQCHSCFPISSQELIFLKDIAIKMVYFAIRKNNNSLFFFFEFSLIFTGGFFQIISNVK